MNIFRNPIVNNSLELLKFTLFQLPVSILTSETALLIAKLGVAEATSLVKGILSSEKSSKSSDYSHNHTENHHGIKEFYYNHLKESLLGGAVYYSTSTFISSAKAVLLFKSYESIFGHSHPKLSGYFKSAYIIYDNAHTTAHILDLLQTTTEAVFSFSTPEEIKHEAFEHFNAAYEFTYDYFTTIAPSSA